MQCQTSLNLINQSREMRFAEISRVQCDIKVSLEFPGLGHPKESPEWLEEEETLLIYTAQGSPFRCKKLSVISGSPEQQRTKTTLNI